MMQVAIFLGDINAVQRRTPSEMRCSAPSSDIGRADARAGGMSISASLLFFFFEKKKKNDICNFQKKMSREGLFSIADLN